MLSSLPFNGALSGAVLSLLVHVGTGGGLYWWFVKRVPPPIVAELDLSAAPLVPRRAAAGGRPAVSPPAWILPKKQVAKPIPSTPKSKPVETKEEVKADEEAPAAPPCTNCADAPADAAPGYIEAADAARKPRWIRNFITPADYPLLARQQGKDGRVVLSVIIGDDGDVRDVRLLQGSYEPLNEVAVRKVRAARFSPAYDAAGRAVSCRVTLPIRFELR